MIGEVVVTMILSAAYSSRIHLFNYAPLQKKNFHREWLPVTIFFGLELQPGSGLNVHKLV